MAVRSPMRGVYHNRNRSSPGIFTATLPYDLLIMEPSLSIGQDDRSFTDLLLKYHDALQPTQSELQSLTNLVNRVCGLIENLIVNPAEFTEGQIEEVKCVGSFKLGTWLARHNTADLVLILRTLPTPEALRGLKTVLEKRLNVGIKDPKEKCVISVHAYGFSVSQDEYSVRVFVTTTPMHVQKADPAIHVHPSTQKMALSAIKQTRWLEENASHTAVKVLTRIIKDFRNRFQGFHHLSSWMVNLLAYHVVMQNPTHQALPVNQAFRRLFHLLAAGMLIPGSVGLIDPCEQGNIRLHTAMSLTEQDELCCTAQTLLRVMMHEGYQLLFSFDETADGASRDQFLKLAAQQCKLPIAWSESIGPLPFSNEGASSADATETQKPVSTAAS